MPPAPKNLVSQSLVQPWLTSELKDFSVDTLPPGYPHLTSRETEDESGSHRIFYFEFHGVGPPLDLDVGRGGDVYVDLTPGAFALWGYTGKGWKQWIDMGEDGKRTLSNEWAVVHPFFDRVLWIGIKPSHCISWFKDGWRNVQWSRRWALDRKLMNLTPHGAGRKEKMVALKEAAAMLGKLKNLRDIQEFPDSVFSSARKSQEEHREKQNASLSPLSDHSDDMDVQGIEHPCDRDPHPISHVQPHLTVELKNFLVTTLPSGYPYRIMPEGNNRFRIPYFQFSDRRPPAPTLDVGTAGDIYLDLTPGAHGLYGKTENGWKRWSEPGESLGNRWPDADWVVQHPHIPDRALWVVASRSQLETGSISWFRGPSSAREGRTTARQRGLIQKGSLEKSGKEIFADASRILEYVLLKKEKGVSPSKKSASASGSSSTNRMK